MTIKERIEEISVRFGITQIDAAEIYRQAFSEGRQITDYRNAEAIEEELENIINPKKKSHGK